MTRRVAATPVGLSGVLCARKALRSGRRCPQNNHYPKYESLTSAGRGRGCLRDSVLMFSDCTWAQLHKVGQLLRGKGVPFHALVVHFPPLPPLVVRGPLLQLEHQRS